MEGVHHDDTAENPPPLADSLWTASKGVLGASVCVCLLTSLFLAFIPLPFFAAWLASPPSFNRSYPLVFDYRELEPSATARLAKDRPLSLWSGSGNRSAGVKAPRTLLKGQRFDVSLHLELPESEHNMELGMFQVSAFLLSPSGQALASTSLPCVLRYRSLPQRIIRATVLAVPMMLGWTKETQHADLDLLRGVMGSVPITAIRVVLHPASGAASRLGLPQILSARIRVRTLLWGSSPWLAFWPATSFFWILGMLCCCEVAGACICFNSFVLPMLGAAGDTISTLSGSKPEPEPVPLGIPLTHHTSRPGGTSTPASRFAHAARDGSSRVIGRPNPVPGPVPAASVASTRTLREVRAPSEEGLGANGLEEDREEEEEVQKVLLVAKRTLQGPGQGQGQERSRVPGGLPASTSDGEGGATQADAGLRGEVGESRQPRRREGGGESGAPSGESGPPPGEGASRETAGQASSSGAGGSDPGDNSTSGTVEVKPGRLRFRGWRKGEGGEES